MRISFVSQHFHPEQVSNNGIARGMAERGHEVTVTTAVPNYPAGRFFQGYSNRRSRSETWRGIRIERARTVPRGRSAVTLIANYLSYALFGSLSALASGHKPDVIFASQLSPITMILPGIVRRWRSGAPLVVWVQDIWPESATYTLGLKSPLIVRPLEWLCGWLYRRADLVLVQSAAFPAMIERFGVPSDRIRLFPNTAPAGYRPVAPAEAPAEAALVPQEGFRLMFAGNIGESQDFDTLIAAAELLRDRPALTWVIVGSGRDMERVQGEIARRGLDDRFVFVGRHPEERMPFFFAHADAMLVSLKKTPIFALTVPYKVQCYMACGKPIVASLDGEGARIVAEAEAGVAAPAGRPEALAAAIRRMVDLAPAERARLGENARRYFDAHFAAEKVFDDLENWLIEAARARGRTRGDSESDQPGY